LRKSVRELVIGSTVGRILGGFTEFIRYLTDVLSYFALLRLSRPILALEVWGPPKELGEYHPLHKEDPESVLEDFLQETNPTETTFGIHYLEIV